MKYSDDQINGIFNHKASGVTRYMEASDGPVKLSKEDMLTLENVIRDSFVDMMDKVYHVGANELSFGPINLDEFDHDALEKLIVEIVHDYFRSE